MNRLFSTLALPLLLALPACDSLWDNGQLAVTVSPTPATVGQTLAVTLKNGTQRNATYFPCETPALERLDGTTWAVARRHVSGDCTFWKDLAAGASATQAFETTGLAPGTYRVTFRPKMDGGEALAVSPEFQIGAR